MRTDLVFGMAGSGGDGIVSAGESLIAAAAAVGYHAIMTKSFAAAVFSIWLGEKPIQADIKQGLVARAAVIVN